MAMHNKKLNLYDYNLFLAIKPYKQKVYHL